MEGHLLHREARAAIDGAPPPADARLAVVRGRAFAALRQVSAASAEYARAGQLAPNDARIHLACFQFHVAQGRWEQAKAEHAAAVRLQPGDRKVLLALFRHHVERGRWQEAAAERDRLLGGQPNDPTLWAECGHCCAELAQWPQARAHLDRALELGLTDEGTWQLYGWLLLHLGDRAGHQRLSASLLEKHGKSDNRNICYGVVRVCTQAPGAVADYAPVVRLAEKVQQRKQLRDLRDLSVLGAALYRAGDFKGAVENLNAAVLQDKGDAIYAHLYLALAQFRFGQTDEALRWLEQADRWYQRAVQERPEVGFRYGWHQPLECQVLRRQAEALIQPGVRREVAARLREKKWAEALLLLDRLPKGGAELPADRATRGHCHAELGRWREACDDYSKAVELGAVDVWGVWYPAALLQLHTGRDEEYRRLCDRLLERFGATEDSRIANRVLIICSLASKPPVDRARLLGITGKASAAFLGYWAYRNGEYEAAVKQLEAALKSQKEMGGQWSRLRLAMAYHRLGRASAARKVLEAADRGIAANAGSLPWYLRLDLQMLRDEAARVLKDSPGPTGRER
jgi:tetratricopeptide (TPR) repeat protein